jgi:hypothetical protein
MWWPAATPAAGAARPSTWSLRCLYRHAEDDGLITAADNPARRVAKPRRLPSTRRAVPDTRLAEINQVAAATGNDPELDTLLLRLHTRPGPAGRLGGGHPGVQPQRHRRVPQAWNLRRTGDLHSLGRFSAPAASISSIICTGAMYSPISCAR